MIEGQKMTRFFNVTCTLLPATRRNFRKGAAIEKQEFMETIARSYCGGVFKKTVAEVNEVFC